MWSAVAHDQRVQQPSPMANAPRPTGTWRSGRSRPRRGSPTPFEPAGRRSSRRRGERAAVERPRRSRRASGRSWRRRATAIVWVQLPWAGIEPYVDIARRRPHLDLRQGRVRRTGRRDGPHPRPGRHARARAVRQGGITGASTASSGSTSVGPASPCSAAAGSPRCSCGCSAPFGTSTRPSSDGIRSPLAGAQRVRRVRSDRRGVTEADLVVLALALTDETRGVIDGRRLSNCCIPNRGSSTSPGVSTS